MIYLAEKTGRFLPTDVRKRAEVISWLMFQMVSTQAWTYAISVHCLPCHVGDMHVTPWQMCKDITWLTSGRLWAFEDKHCHEADPSKACSLLLILKHLQSTASWLCTTLVFIWNYAVLTVWCWQGGIGPMQGQAAHFVKFAPEKIEYGIKRYTSETKRLYGVIEKALSDGRQWLAAGEYTIADMANFSWMFVHHMAGTVLHPVTRLEWRSLYL